MKGGSPGSMTLIALVRQVARATQLRQTWHCDSSMCGKSLALGDRLMVRSLIVKEQDILYPCLVRPDCLQSTGCNTGQTSVASIRCQDLHLFVVCPAPDKLRGTDHHRQAFSAGHTAGLVDTGRMLATWWAAFCPYQASSPGSRAIVGPRWLRRLPSLPR